MANVVTNPTANQTIDAFDLLPASGNTTQSLGLPAAQWLAYLGFSVFNGGTVIVLTGSSDPYGGLISSAISALPASGGVIDARAPGVASVAQGSIDPSTTPVTILFGPYSYTVTNIMLRPGMTLAGSGKASSLTLTSTATAMFSVPQTTTDGVADNVVIQDLTLLGHSGNSSQVCMDFDTSGAASGCATEYSTFQRLNIQQFGGANIVLAGAASDWGHAFQFLSFIDIDIYTATSTGPAFQISGGGGQCYFHNVFMQGPSGTAGTLVSIVSGGGSAYSYNLDFYSCTFQGSEVGISAAQTNSLLIDAGHFETVEGLLLLGASTQGTTMSNCFVAGTCGVGTSGGLGVGNGYVVNINSGSVKGLIFKGNTIYGGATPPDNIVINSSYNIPIDVLTNTNASATTSLGLWNSGNGVTFFAQSASIGTAPSPWIMVTTQSSGGSGLYRVDYYMVISRAASGGTPSSSLQMILAWADGTIAAQTANVPSSAITSNALGAFAAGSQIVFIADSHQLGFHTLYSSSGTTSMEYNLFIRVQPLQ